MPFLADEDDDFGVGDRLLLFNIDLFTCGEAEREDLRPRLVPSTILSSTSSDLLDAERLLGAIIKPFLEQQPETIKRRQIFI